MTVAASMPGVIDTMPHDQPGRPAVVRLLCSKQLPDIMKILSIGPDRPEGKWHERKHWILHRIHMSSIPLSRQIYGLLAWLALVFAVAAVGGLASANAGDFYGQLVRPAWAPPGWLFAPVWSALYLSMGVAAWLVWRVGGFRGARGALGLFLIQLAVNALWTWLFFVWQQGALAFAEILLLWALILGTISAFWRVRALAGILLLPYLAWVSFACLLTYATWQLNPQLLA